jgi:hypothetical protein
MLAMVSQVAWFDAVSHAERRAASQSAVREYMQSCGSQWPVRWAADWKEAGKVVRGLNDTTGFWTLEQRWREQALAAVQAANRGEALAGALHRLSVVGYEAVRPVVADEELARVASGAALWTLAEALIWATADDVLAPLPNPFLPKLKLFELGHWPLGLSQGSIVVA